MLGCVPNHKQFLRTNVGGIMSNLPRGVPTFKRKEHSYIGRGEVGKLHPQIARRPLLPTCM